MRKKERNLKQNRQNKENVWNLEKVQLTKNILSISSLQVQMFPYHLCMSASPSFPLPLDCSHTL